MESETEDDETQANPVLARKGQGQGRGHNQSTDSLGYHGGSTEDEREYDVPVLAADEVARTPGAEFMEPAVSPQERRGSGYYSGLDSEIHRTSSRSGSAANSRPSSRPASVHSFAGISRFSTHDEDRENMHTPLEDVDEYEPLFPDEDGNKERRPITAAQRLKLREQMKRFPSKDIWEDSPESAQLQASVASPEPSNDQPDPLSKGSSAIFETPQQEGARKGEISESEKVKLIPKEERLAKSNFQPHIRDEMRRPYLSQRFPSRDIWEDSPDSARLETTVGDSAASDVRSPIDAGLEAGAAVNTSGSPKGGILAGEQSRDNATVGAAAAKPTIPPRPNKDKAPLEDIPNQPPSVPARPPKRLHQVPPADAYVPVAPSKLSEVSSEEPKQISPTEARKGPSLPERGKPQIPARPVKPVGRESSETEPLSKVTSASSAGSDGQTDRELGSVTGAPKPKPAVPARPAGGKIASLKAGFLSDLDSRLKLGPQGPKPSEKAEPEVEEEKAPLADARKGRAKGPARRKPVSPAPTATGAADEPQEKSATRSWQIQQPWTVWHHDGTIRVGKAMSAPEKSESLPAEAPKLSDSAGSTEQPEAPGEAHDMQQAKAAVEESLVATDPLAEGKLKTPQLDPPSPADEKANPLSKGPSNEPTPGASSPATVISPSEEKPPLSDPLAEAAEKLRLEVQEHVADLTEGATST